MKYNNFNNKSLLYGLEREIADYKVQNEIEKDFPEIADIIYNLRHNNMSLCAHLFDEYYQNIRHYGDYLGYLKKNRNISHMIWMKRICLLFYVFISISDQIQESDKSYINIAIYGSKRPTSDIDLSIIYLGNNRNYIGIYKVIKLIEDQFIHKFTNTYIFDIEIYAGLISTQNNNSEYLFVTDINKYIDITENEYLTHFLPYIFIAFVRNIVKTKNGKINKNMQFYIKLLKKYLIDIKKYILNDIGNLSINRLNINRKTRKKTINNKSNNVLNELKKSIVQIFNSYKYKKCIKNIDILKHHEQFTDNIKLGEINNYLTSFINLIIEKLTHFDFIGNTVYKDFVDSFHNFDMKRQFYYDYVKDAEKSLTNIRNIMANKNYPDNMIENKTVYIKYIKASCICDIFRDENYVFPFSITTIVRNKYFYGSNNIIYELFLVLIEQFGFLYRFKNSAKKYKYQLRINIIKRELHIIRDLLIFKNYLIQNNMCKINVYNNIDVKMQIDKEFKKIT